MVWSASGFDSGSWRHLAACREVDPKLFFPVGTAGPAVEAQVAGAKAICAACPIRGECLRFAVTTNQEYGIWGGLDEHERRDLRRQWRRRARRQMARS